MNLKQITEFRRAIKTYSDKKISNEDWNQLIDFIYHSPTSMNWQPWRAIVIERDSELLSLLSEQELLFNEKVIKESAKTIIFVTPKEEEFGKTEFNLKRSRNNLFLKKLKEDKKANIDDISDEQVSENLKLVMKMLKLMKIDNPESWAKRQAYIALGFAMVGAANLGIDTTPMEGINPELLNDILWENDYISESETSAIAISFGYRKDETAHNPTNRFSKEEVFINVK